MNKKITEIPQDEVFGNYNPKLSPDTVLDYLHKVCPGDACREGIENLPAGELANLNKLIVMFKQYKSAAKEFPGRYQEGNIILGAPKKEYLPSESELIFAEIGKRIEIIVIRTDKAELQNYLYKNQIPDKQLEFSYFEFSHTDVMGSGRFFYASEPIKKTIALEWD